MPYRLTVAVALVLTACTAAPALSPTPTTVPVNTLVPPTSPISPTTVPANTSVPAPTPIAPTPGPTAAASARPTPAPPGSVEAARADIEKLVLAIERNHRALFEYVPEADWRAAADRLEALVPELVPNQPERLLVEVLRLVALPGVRGGRHSHAGADYVAPGRPLAIATYTFADGVYVIRALPDQQDLVGSRLVAVAGRPIEEIRDLVDPLVAQDNEWTPEIWLLDQLRQPAILVGLGIIDRAGPVEMTFVDSAGASRDVVIPLLGEGDVLEPEQPLDGWPADLVAGYAEFINLHYLPQRPAALWTSRMDEPMWWTTLRSGSVLFIQQNVVGPPPDELLAEIVEAASDPGVRRVILDLRHNLGGNDATSTSLAFRDPAIDQPGQLFVLTSTNVYSATMHIVDELDRLSSATFVGEPTGGGPDGLGGSVTVRLDGLPIPMTVGVPWTAPGSLSDRPLTIFPDIDVPLTGIDYFADQDPALEAVLGQ